MKISEFKYVLMEIGGGWEYSHDLYGIKANGEVYHTTDFVGITARTELDMCLAGKMNEEDVVFEYPQNPTFVFDAPTYHILEVLGEGMNDLNLVYKKEDSDVGLIEKVHHAAFDYNLEKRMKLLYGPNWKEDKRAVRYVEELTKANKEKATSFAHDTIDTNKQSQKKIWFRAGMEASVSEEELQVLNSGDTDAAKEVMENIVKRSILSGETYIVGKSCGSVGLDDYDNPEEDIDFEF